MDWAAVVSGLIGSFIVGPAGTYWFSRRVERQKSRQGKELMGAQNAFSVGTTSHMATVVFDKHIEFCEAYTAEVYRALHVLTPDGPPQKTFEPERFAQVRQKWALWLTPKIEDELDWFEFAMAQTISGSAVDYNLDGPVSSNQESVKRLIASLRKVLGTEELTALRNQLVRGAFRDPTRVETEIKGRAGKSWFQN